SDGAECAAAAAVGSIAGVRGDGGGAAGGGVAFGAGGAAAAVGGECVSGAVEKQKRKPRMNTDEHGFEEGEVSRGGNGVDSLMDPNAHEGNGGAAQVRAAARVDDRGGAEAREREEGESKTGRTGAVRECDSAGRLALPEESAKVEREVNNP